MLNKGREKRKAIIITSLQLSFQISQITVSSFDNIPLTSVNYICKTEARKQQKDHRSFYNKNRNITYESEMTNSLEFSPVAMFIFVLSNNLFNSEENKLKSMWQVKRYSYTILCKIIFNQ